MWGRNITKTNEKIKISGILITAGLSNRMGKLKALLEYDQSTFIVNILTKMLKACDEVIVVLGHEAEKIQAVVNKNLKNSKIKFIHNPDYTKGMLTSLQAGIKAIKNADWVLYHFVDQPGLPEVFYKQFADETDENFDWIQPQYDSRNGHPILINKNLFNEILQLPFEKSLRNVSYKVGVIKKYWQCSFQQIFQDIDYPEEYERMTEN